MGKDKDDDALFEELKKLREQRDEDEAARLEAELVEILTDALQKARGEWVRAWGGEGEYDETQTG